MTGTTGKPPPIPGERLAQLRMEASQQADIGRTDKLRQQLLDLRWLVTKMTMLGPDGPAQIDADLSLVHDPEIVALRTALQQNLHLLIPLTDKKTRLITLLSRLSGIPELKPIIQRFEQRVPFAYLRAAWPLPDLSTTGVMRVLLSHTEQVNICRFSLDSNRLITGDSSGRTLVWDVESGEDIHEFIRQATNDTLTGLTGVTACATGPDGQLAVGFADGVVLVWRLTSSGEEELLHTLHDGESFNDHVSEAWFFSDGIRLLIRHGPRNAHVWDLSSGNRLLSTSSDFSSWGPLRALGRWLAITGFSNVVEVWDLIEKRHHRTLQGHQGYIEWINVLAPWLITADHEGIVKVWDPDNGNCIATFIGGHGAVAVDRATGRIVYPRGRSRVRICNPTVGDTAIAVAWWRLRKSIRRRLDSIGYRLTSTSYRWPARLTDLYFRRYGRKPTQLWCAVDDDAAWIATVGNHDFSSGGLVRAMHEISFYDPATGFIRHRDYCANWCVQWAGSSKQAWLATMTDQGAVHLWDPRSGELTHTIPGMGSKVTACTTSPAGDRLAVADDTGWIRLINPKTSPDPERVDSNSIGMVSCVVHPGGKWIATTDKNRVTYVRDALTGQVLHELVSRVDGFSGGYPSGGIDLALLGDRWLATTDGDGTVRIWDAETGKQLRAIPGETGDLVATVFTQHHRWLATAEQDGRIRIWDPIQANLSHVLRGHTQKAQTGAASADGTLLATSSHDSNGEVVLWNPLTGERVRVLPGHGEYISVDMITIDPAARWIATGSSHGILQIWDVATGRLRAESRELPRLRTGAVSPDGAILVTCHLQGDVMIWNPLTGALLRKARHQSAAGFSISPTGRWLASVGTGLLQVSSLLSTTPAAAIAVYGGIGECQWLPSERQVCAVGNSGTYLFDWLPNGSRLTGTSLH